MTKPINKPSPSQNRASGNLAAEASVRQLGSAPPDQMWWWKTEPGRVLAGFTKGICPAHPSEGLLNRCAAAAHRLTGLPACQARQIHSAEVAIVAGTPSVIEGADALVTASPGLALCIRTADCVPVLLWTDDLIAAVHAGWRGLAAGIIARALTTLSNLGARPEAIRAAIGPAIGPCCYEVGEDVAHALSRLPGGNRAVFRRGESWFADLPALAKSCLAAAGVPLAAIHSAWACTRCHPRHFYSYRRDGGLRGVQLAIIALRP